MNKLIQIIIIILTWFIISACADISEKDREIDASSVYIQATSNVEITLGGDEPERGSLNSKLITNPQVEASSNVSISVVNNATATMTLSPWSNPGAQTPTQNTTTIQLGSIGVATLFDNDLNHCPANANNHCNTAGFAAYMQTTAGLVNTVDATEVMPILLSGPLTVLTALSTTSPGLFLQSISVAANKHTVKLTDFSPVPSYPVYGDFSLVGAGTYNGTLTIVYFIAN